MLGENAAGSFKLVAGFLTGKLYRSPKSKFSTANPKDIPKLFKPVPFKPEPRCWFKPNENSPNCISCDKNITDDCPCLV